jgi:hypothetical protein
LAAALNTDYPLPLGFASASIICVPISTTLQEQFARKTTFASSIAWFITLEILSEAAAR